MLAFPLVDLCPRGGAGVFSVLFAFATVTVSSVLVVVVIRLRLEVVDPVVFLPEAVAVAVAALVTEVVNVNVDAVLVFVADVAVELESLESAAKSIEVSTYVERELRDDADADNKATEAVTVPPAPR